MGKKNTHKPKQKSTTITKSWLQDKELSIRNENFQWRFTNFDFDFPEDLFEHLTLEGLMTKIIPALQNHEDKKWGTMRSHPDHHVINDIAQSKNPAPAKRLENSKFDDIENNIIYSFSIDRKKRLYGYIDGAIFYVLWYDHLHLLYPSNKQNT